MRIATRVPLARSPRLAFSGHAPRWRVAMGLMRPVARYQLLVD